MTSTECAEELEQLRIMVKGIEVDKARLITALERVSAKLKQHPELSGELFGNITFAK